nr:zinc knuckle CX2CX4HX4C [Tanacetum cinerariifolium]
MELSEGTNKREGSFSQISRVSKNPNSTCDENSYVFARVEGNRGVSYQVVGDGSKTTRVSNNPSASFPFGMEANQTTYVAATYDQDAIVSNMVTHHDIIYELFELTKENRQKVTDIFCAKFKAFKAKNCDASNPSKFTPSDPIVKYVDINTKSTSYAGVAGASSNDQPKVNSNFLPLVVDHVFDGVNISIPRKVVKKKWSMDTKLLKEELSHILIWVKLYDIPIQVFKEDSICLIATFIGKPVMLDSYTGSMCNDSWGHSSFAWCLIAVNSEADLVDVVTIGIPSFTRDDFTKETC